MRFCDVLQAVRQWIDMAACRQGLGTDVVRCDDAGLRVFFESTDKVGELIVAQADFAPYRFVSFQVLDTDEKPVFCYYDSECSTITEILGKLDEGLQMI